MGLGRNKKIIVVPTVEKDSDVEEGDGSEEDEDSGRGLLAVINPRVASMQGDEEEEEEPGDDDNPKKCEGQPRQGQASFNACVGNRAWCNLQVAVRVCVFTTNNWRAVSSFFYQSL